MLGVTARGALRRGNPQQNKNTHTTTTTNDLVSAMKSTDDEYRMLPLLIVTCAPRRESGGGLRHGPFTPAPFPCSTQQDFEPYLQLRSG